MKHQCNKKYGFTLLELLVVILIIAVLAAVALPKYKQTVLKSRFSTVMPVAKAVADANEVYYLGSNMYALNADELDVVPGEGVTITLPTTEQDESYNFVMASRSDLPNAHYIQYQRHSVNYPSEIHCEAKDEDMLANWLCERALKGRNIGQTLTEGYTTYVLEGEGNGISPMYAQALESASCDIANSLGLECSTTLLEGGSVSKKVCYSVDNPNDYCISVKYNSEGLMTSRSGCLRRSNNPDVCLVRNETIYDEKGRKFSERICQHKNESTGDCETWYGGKEYRYDQYGNKIAERTCQTRDSQGNCTKITSGIEYEYQDGKLMAQHNCSSYEGNTCTQWSTGTEYKYDPQTGKLSEKLDCNRYNADNVCDWYTNDGSVQYRATANANQQEELQCARQSDGSCSRYIRNTLVTYDERGNRILELPCNGQRVSEASGSCSRRADNATEYVYDDDNRLVSTRTCRVDEAGECDVYLSSGSSTYDYRYDDIGHLISERSCTDRDTDTGNCNGYKDSYFYTYDTAGNRTSSTWCQYFDENDNCTGSPSIYAYQYDENNNLIATVQCKSLDEQNQCAERTPVATQFSLD